jgi:hypothetical protein
MRALITSSVEKFQRGWIRSAWRRLPGKDTPRSSTAVTLGNILDRDYAGVGACTLKSGYITGKMLEEFHSCYEETHLLTSIMTFIENGGHKPA